MPDKHISLMDVAPSKNAHEMVSLPLDFRSPYFYLRCYFVLEYLWVAFFYLSPINWYLEGGIVEILSVDFENECLPCILGSLIP